MNFCSHADLSSAARILAEESLEGQEVVFAMTMVCLVLRTLIVVQKENLAQTENSCLQMLNQLLLDFLAVLLTDIKPQEPSREESGVRNAAENDVHDCLGNVYQPHISSRNVNCGLISLQLVPKLQFFHCV